ncbi:MAG: PrgI family protein [Gordonibacter sp.]|uniref:PrgI family protein n=1 Tax=Gordonibacter sp. TaxID=1968902 RepID=UPI002B3F4426|nr:PrgI family protein [Gordonibacter sp.]
MLSVSIHKDIGEYTEKVLGKLSLRTLACVAGGFSAAIAAAACTYFVLGIEVSDATLPVMLCSMPFWLAGFWRPSGMKLEQFMSLWFQHTFTDDRILYSSSIDLLEPNMHEQISEKTDHKGQRKAKRKGAELYEPSSEDV